MKCITTAILLYLSTAIFGQDADEAFGTTRGFHDLPHVLGCAEDLPSCQETALLMSVSVR
jgi:hypothetical protein